MSSSGTKCQICGDDSHTAMECPILDFNCERCDHRMKLDRNGNGTLSCSRKACLETTTVSRILDKLNWKPPPSKPTVSKPEPCFHCGETNHKSMMCEWKTKRCYEENCPGSLFIRGATNMKHFRFGERYLQCEVCHRIDWLEDLIRDRDIEDRANNRKLMEIIHNAKEKEKRRRGET